MTPYFSAQTLDYFGTCPFWKYSFTLQIQYNLKNYYVLFDTTVAISAFGWQTVLLGVCLHSSFAKKY